MALDFEYIFTGKLTGDCLGLQIDFAQRLNRLFQPLREIPLEIVIRPFRRLRTIAQNNYIWGVVIPTVRAWMKETTGSCPSKEGLYAFLRTSVVGQEVIIEIIEEKDTPVINGKRFSQMTTVEFAEAIDKIILHYAEKGLVIPLPVPKTNNYVTDFIKDFKDE